MSKKHNRSSSKQSTVCSSCEQEFPGYYSFQQDRRKEHGAKQRKPSYTVADLNKFVEEKGENGEKRKEEIRACNNFWWIRSWKMEDIRFSTSKYPSQILEKSTRNMKKSTTSSILPQKSTLPWGLFFEISTLVNIDNSTPRKTVL